MTLESPDSLGSPPEPPSDTDLTARLTDPERLAALRATGLLDSPPEVAFDRLTHLATSLLGVPVALVSLVDEHRQFFKSAVGLAEPWRSLRETPLSHSICQNLVGADEPLILSDTRTDPKVRDSLAISALNVIAYAGIPLRTSSGHTLGAFCAIDNQPRTWTDSEIDVLRELAASAMTEIELRMATAEAKQRAGDAERARADKEAVLERLTDAFFALDTDWRFTYVNRQAERLLQRAAADLLGQCIWEALPDARRLRFYSECQRAVGEQSTIAFEEFHPTLGAWLEAHLYPSPDGLSVYFSDTTARRRSDDQQRFLAEASRLLAASLDYTITLQRVADLCVPFLADWCIIYILDAEGNLQRVAAAHRDDRDRATLEEFLRHPVAMRDDSSLVRVLRDGETVVLPEVTPALMSAAIPDPAQMARIQSIGVGAGMGVPLRVRGRTLGVLALNTGRSGRAYSPADIATAEELALHAALAVDNALLYAAEQRARQAAELAAARTARLQAFTAALSEALLPEQVARVVVEQGVAAMGAVAGSVLTISHDGAFLDIVAAKGYPGEIVSPWQRFPLSSDVPLAETARTSEPIWVESRRELEAARGRWRWSPLLHEAWAAMPLVVENRVLGAIGLSFATPQRFTADDKSYMLAIAQQGAQALERARLYAAEQRARAEAEAIGERLRGLQSVLEAVLGHLALDDALSALLDRIRAVLNVETAAIFLMEDDGETLLARAAKCLDEPVSSGYRVRVGQGFAGRVAAERRPVLIDSLDAVAAVSTSLRKKGVRSLLGVPLVLDNRILGVLHVGTLSETRFDEDDIRLLQQVADRVTLAIRQASLYEAEHRARSEAESQRQRAAFLAEASAVLASSLDYETTLANVARLAVPTFADWCVIDLRVGDEIHRVEAATNDPERAAILAEIQVRYPVDVNGPHPIAQVLRSGEPLLATSLPDSFSATVGKDAGHAELLRRLDPRSAVVVPMTSRGEMIGLLSFVSHQPGRFGPDDLVLATELARRAAVAVDNARLYRESQRAIRTRDEFISVASHELKTPLTSLQLAVQTIQRQADKGSLADIPPARLKSVVQSTELQLKRLTNLVNDLLDVSRISAGRLELERTDVDLSAVVHAVVAQFSEDAPRSGVAIELDAHSAAVGHFDRFRIDQVVTNLVSNAIKYGNGKPVRVQVSTDPDHAWIHVRDQGIGISPADRERIFNRFERTATARSYGGLGLGLYITRQIVEAHGGEIWVESEPGRGSTFVVKLPRAAPAPDPSPPSNAQLTPNP